MRAQPIDDYATHKPTRKLAGPSSRICTIQYIPIYTPVWNNANFVPVTKTDIEATTARKKLAEMLMRTGLEDREAFHQVYLMTNAKLFGICLRICYDRRAAEDVLQEVYLLIWKRAGAWEPGHGSPITWLATIARNRAIDWRRSQAIRPTTSDDLLLEIADPTISAQDRLLDDEEIHRLHECLGLLDNRQSTAIRAAFFNGLTYAELADHQSVSLSAIKSRVRRGLSLLKTCLENA